MILMQRVWRLLAQSVAGAVFMAVVVTVLALARGTTGYDWYAAGRLVYVEAMLAAGFDPLAPMEYRAADGSVHRITRLGFAHSLDAWQSRRRILATITGHVVLGAIAGFAGALFSAILASRDRTIPATVEARRRNRRCAGHDVWGLIEVPAPGKDAGEGTSMASVDPGPLIDTLAPTGYDALPPGEGIKTSRPGHTYRPEPSDAASAGREETAKTEEPVENEKTVLDGVGGPPGRVAESSPGQGDGQNGGADTGKSRNRYIPGGDGRWF